MLSTGPALPGPGRAVADWWEASASRVHRAVVKAGPGARWDIHSIISALFCGRRWAEATR